MSASSKKKLRKEQNAAVLTQKQLQQNKEAKKLKKQTLTFVIVLILIAAIALTTLTVNLVNRSGYFQNNTIALILDDFKLTSTMFNYYFMDAINDEYNEWYESYGSYVDVIMSMNGLTLSEPLDEQIYDEETGATWADHFRDTAIENARFEYAMCKLAQQDGHKLSEDEEEELKLTIDSAKFYSLLYGYSNLQQYLEYSYGFGVNEENYTEYCRINALATSYYTLHEDSLKYDEAAIREYETERYDDYSAFTYTEVYLSYRDFLTGGTKSESGSITYSDEEKDAAVLAAKAAAESLLTATSADELKQALLAMKLEDAPIYKDEEALADILVEYEDIYKSSITHRQQEWLLSADRKAGDITVIENSTTSTSTDENGVETSKTTIGGYYVLLFHERNDNTFAMGDVRHLLVEFEGGTKNSNGTTTYSDTEKKAALDKAEKLLKEWKEGEAGATLEAFIELVKANTDDTASAETGGLYEGINPSSGYVASFKNWALDADRKEGDVEIIESSYGYHIMYYVGDNALTYRDYMITNDMRANDMDAWKKECTETVTVEMGDMKYIDFGRSIK